MELNVAKCSAMHFGPGTASDIVISVNDEMHLLSDAQTVRDLEESVTGNFESSEQTDRVVARAR